MTRADSLEFLELAARIPVRSRVTSYPLAAAGRAMEDLRRWGLQGSAVVTVR